MRRPCWAGRWRRAAGAIAALAASGVGLGAAVKLTDQGWPLARTDDELAAAAGIVLLASLPLRTAGWRLLIAGSRPSQAELLAASGAAYVSGAVLPSQLHHVVKAAALRRLRPHGLTLEAIAVSLLALSLLDAAALAPMALVGAVTGPTGAVQGALAGAALVGLGAGCILLGAGRLGRRLARSSSRRLQAFGRCASRTLVEARDLWTAGALMLAFWFARAAGVLILLDAMGLAASPELAIALVALSAASAALPLGLLGSVAQVTSAAAILAASGVDTGRAVALGLALTMLVPLASTSLALLALAWRRFGRMPGLLRSASG